MRFPGRFLDSLAQWPPWPRRRYFRLETRTSTAEIFQIKNFVQKVCDAAGYLTGDANIVKLAVEEVCTNVTRHAYQNREDGKVSLEMGIGSRDLRIKITDYGRSFDFESVRNPDLNQYIEIGKKGGLGILFIKRIMSRVSYRVYPDRNEWILVHCLPKTPLKIPESEKIVSSRPSGVEAPRSRTEGNQQAIVDQERLRKELKIAQEIQQALLPREFPKIEGYEIGATYRTANEVGGDYYDFIWVDPTTLGIVVADVSGKGVPSSMVMTMIRTALRLEARRNRSASNVLIKVNQHVINDMKTGMFVTMFYIILDSFNRSINFASAGHNPMILYRGSTDEVYFLKPKGFPLGIDLPDENMFARTLTLQKVDLEKDDMLVIYTDGVTEAMNPENEQFGEERLVQVIKDSARLTPAEFVEKLNGKLAEFIRGAAQSDDITLVAIKENMGVEEVIYRFRKRLIDLVAKEGLSVGEACRQMNVSTKDYRQLKKIHDKKGDAGLRPLVSRKRSVMKELSIPQKQAVISAVKKNPEYGSKQIVEFLSKSGKTPIRLDTKVVNEYLNRKGLGSVKERKTFAANEIDMI